MPARRNAKPATSRAAAKSDPNLRSSLIRVVLHLGFRVPDWEYLPPSYVEGSLGRRLWTSLSNKVLIACSSIDVDASGVLTFYIDLPCDPNQDDAFPADYAISLADQISEGVSDLVADATWQSMTLPIRPFPEWGDVEVGGQFIPDTLLKPLASKGDTFHSGGKDETAKAGRPVGQATSASSEDLERWKTSTETMLSSFGGDYSQLSHELSAVNHEIRHALAARLEPALNAAIQEMPHDTYEEKKALARWINEEVRQFGLAAKCPKTGRPAILLAGPGDDPMKGRFQFDIITPEGKRKRTVSSVILPVIALTEAPVRRSADGGWVDRVAGGSDHGPATPS